MKIYMKNLKEKLMGRLIWICMEILLLDNIKIIMREVTITLKECLNKNQSKGIKVGFKVQELMYSVMESWYQVKVRQESKLNTVIGIVQMQTLRTSEDIVN